jgi:hypothetical protein
MNFGSRKEWGGRKWICENWGRGMGSQGYRPCVISASTRIQFGSIESMQTVQPSLLDPAQSIPMLYNTYIYMIFIPRMISPLNHHLHHSDRGTYVKAVRPQTDPNACASQTDLAPHTRPPKSTLRAPIDIPRAQHAPARTSRAGSISCDMLAWQLHAYRAQLFQHMQASGICLFCT